MEELFKQPFVTAVYFDRTFHCHTVKIGPGEYHVTDKDIMISTVLGSCVSVCIRDSDRAIGGMNHFLLPCRGAAIAANPVSECARYGAYAIELLINQILKMGGVRGKLEAKVFGGGKVLHGVSDVGRLNGEFALEYLHIEGIRLMAEDLGGIYPRKVYYSPSSGKVYVRQLKSLRDESIAKLEEAYLQRLKKLGVEGDVELF